MSGDRDSELRDEERPVDLDGGTAEDDSVGVDALRALLGPRGEGEGQLAAPDHEALLAMTLGEDVAEYTDDELAAAEALRCALDGEGGRDPLAELAGALREAARAAHALHEEGLLLDERPDRELAADHEALLAVAIGTEPDVAEHERTAARRLAQDLDREPLVSALRAAHGGTGLDLDEDDEAVLRTVALEAAGFEATWRLETVAAADELRAALEGDGDAPLLPWAQALRASAGMLNDIDELSHERSLRAALRGGDASDSDGAGGAASTGRVTRGPAIWMGAVMAVAAALALFIGFGQGLEQGPPRNVGVPGPVAGMTAPEMLEVRSTQELFDPTVPFASKGGESDRVDKILSARASDLRKNRFAAWGVR